MKYKKIQYLGTKFFLTIGVPITGLLLFFISSVKAQNVFQKTYGGTANDFGEGIKATSDAGFILTGSTRSYGTLGAEARDFLTMKANLLGITTWTRELGTTDKRQEGKIVKTTSDGGYIVGGRTFEISDATTNDSWLLKKYNSVGTPVYENVFGRTGVTSPPAAATWDDELWAIDETPPPYPADHATMFGFTMNYRKPNKRDMTFVIYNMAGAAVSITRHIGTDTATMGSESGRDFIYESGSGAYTLIGESDAMVGGNGLDFLAVKLTAAYGLGVYKSFGGTGSEYARTILKTSDGGYFMMGWTNSPGVAGVNDILAIKTDVNFNLTWAKVIGGTGDELGIQAKQTSDGGYIIIGQTTSFNTFSAGGTDMFVVKLNSAGTLAWAKVYGGSGYDDGRNLDIRSDGGFFFSGSCSEPVSPAGNGQDIFVVAANSTGYSGGCNEASVTPTVNNIVLTSATTGLFMPLPNTAMEMIANPMTANSTAPTLTCKCENIAPNYEISGLTQVCHNTTHSYYINSIPGHTNYLWTLTGATFSVAPGPTDTLVSINFTTTNTQLIVATNDGNCSDFVIDTINITIDNISTTITTLDSLLCIGDATDLISNTVANQGAIASWSWTPTGPNNPINSVSPGITTVYSVTVTDSWGCTAGDNITVQVFDYPVVNIGPNDTVCNGGPVLLDATTVGGTYLWNTTATTATISAPTSGIYWVDVTTNGCTTRDSIILGISTDPLIVITGDDSICVGENTILTATPSGGTGPYTFLWASGLGTANNINVSPIINTTYTVTVTESYGCTNTETQLVNVFSYPIVDLGPDSSVCNGVVPFVTLDAQNGGASYVWSTSATAQTINVAVSGIYWVDVSINGCTTRDSAMVAFGTAPTSDYTGNTTICAGISTMMYGNGSGGTAPYTYIWSQGPTSADSISLSPIINTNYNIITIDSVGCSDTAYFTITANPYPIVKLGLDTIGCISTPIILFAPVTTGTTLWSTGASTDSITIPTADTVWVDITENGCTTRDSIVITYYPNPTVNLGPDTIMCSIQNIMLDAANIFSTYLWSNADTTASVLAVQTNLYWVEVTSCGTTVSDSILIVMDTFSLYIVSLVPNNCSENNGSLTIGSTSVYPTTYQWTVGASGTNPALVNISDGNFIVDATDSVGCLATATIPLVCNIPPIIIPQFMSPNGDGDNNTWIIQGINSYPTATVKIFNRWGNQVYSASPYNNDWNGMPNSGNGYLPTGTYFYFVDLYGDGKDIRSGYIELQR